MPVEHVNTFDNDDDFMLHFAAACEIARHPLNYIRACDGEDLLGVPMITERGKVMERDGHVVWQQAPTSGFVPSPIDPKAWQPVPFLAPHVQTVQTSDAALLRITPEVRVERDGAETLARLVRTLSIELRITGAVELTDIVRDQLKASFRKYIVAFFPLHPEVECEEHTGPPQEEQVEFVDDDGEQKVAVLAFTSMLYRFRGPHQLG